MGAYENYVGIAKEYMKKYEEADNMKTAYKFALLSAKSWLEAYDSTEDEMKRKLAITNYTQMKRTAESLEFKIKSGDQVSTDKKLPLSQKQKIMIHFSKVLNQDTLLMM